MKYLLGGFFEGVVGFDQIALPVVLEGSEEREDDVGVLRVGVGLLEEPGGVLEEVKGVGEGEEEGGVGGDGEEGLEGSSVLGRNGVGEAVQVVRYPSMSFPVAHVCHCYLLIAYYVSFKFSSFFNKQGGRRCVLMCGFFFFFLFFFQFYGRMLMCFVTLNRTQLSLPWRANYGTKSQMFLFFLLGSAQILFS